MLPSPAELKYFVETARTGNISRAAERLGITQPALSQSLRKLESSLGTPLLVRGKTGVQPTHRGRIFLTQARALLEEWDKLRDEASRDEEELRGQYSLGCHPSVGLYTVPLFLPKLLRENPGLEIRLSHDLSRRITEDVVSYRVDFGITVNPTSHPDLVIKTLCHDEVGLWVGKGKSPLQDLQSGDAVILCDPDLIQTQSVLRQMEKKGLRYRRRVQSGSLELIRSLAAAGTGVAILPSRVAQLDGANTLRPALANGPVHLDRICLVYRADTQKTRASRSVARAIEQALTQS